ncbi:prepilin peptidase [Mixta intestinalis]|jgi:general secretion pathway protein O|uniref:Prepilin leader peptidase/N-methyltransferase n=1 Tax=Mixta intestinalis TaxID=1615494 RepID=A0A6P1Q547_9GAMM|nr:A24 family peptidase [Mixta intestinalis]QHM73561.1 Type 4 prepilin-like proteins leader peptide-processing enzyme [Mixta intestinalis]
MIIFFAALAGLATGSFLCLAADRYYPGLNERQWLVRLLAPPSRCHHCQRRIKLYDLIPFYSWVRLRGRCRYCDCRIPCRLLIVEVVTCTLFSLLAMSAPSPHALIFALLFTALLILLSLIDWRHLLLPDALTLPLLWLGLLYHLLFSQEKLPAAVIGAISGWLALWLLYWFFLLITRREGLGYGDLKLYAALGAWCGWQMLPLIAIGAALGGLLLFLHNRRWKGGAGVLHQQPFGPCLSLGGWITFFGLWQEEGAIFLL